MITVATIYDQKPGEAYVCIVQIILLVILLLLLLSSYLHSQKMVFLANNIKIFEVTVIVQLYSSCINIH